MVFKTRIKRSSFIINAMIITLMGVAAGTLLLTAYGSTCVQFRFSPVYWTMMFPHYPDFIVAYSITYFLSWILAFVWGLVIYWWLTQKRFAHIFALAVSGLGFIAQAIPGVLSDTGGFSDPFDFGSPHWGGAIANLLIFIVLVIGLIPIKANPINNAIKSATARDNKWGGSRQLTMVSMFLFWLAIVSFLGSTFMRDAHMVQGVNIWQAVGYQYVIGAIIAGVGTTTLTAAFVIHKVRPLTTV